MKTAVYVVLLASGLLRVGLTASGGVASGFVTVPYNAEGRREAMAAAGQLVTEYGPNHATSTLIMAGAFPRDAHRPFVVAAVTDEPAERLTALSELSGHAMHKYMLLAAAATAQTVGEEVPYAIPIDAEFGVLPPQAVAVDAAATRDGTELFERRCQDGASAAHQARRALDDEARQQAAAGDDDMAQYLLNAATWWHPSPPASCRLQSLPPPRLRRSG